MADTFTTELRWSGVEKGPVVDTATFSRDLEVSFGGDGPLPMSAAPGFMGDPDRYNPEELVVGAVSACQALTYLFLAVRKGVRVVGYTDRAEATLGAVDGRIRLTNFTLRPIITVDRASDVELARELVEKAHRHCLVANSLTSDVRIEPQFEVASTAASAVFPVLSA